MHIKGEIRKNQHIHGIYIYSSSNSDVLNFCVLVMLTQKSDIQNISIFQIWVLVDRKAMATDGRACVSSYTTNFYYFSFEKSMRDPK
jgi:hypothetical protein